MMDSWRDDTSNLMAKVKTVGAPSPMNHGTVLEMDARRHHMQEERYLSLVGCAGEVSSPKQVIKPKSVKEEIKLERNDNSSHENWDNTGCETRELMEAEFGQCVQVQQPGSSKKRPMYCKHLVYQGATEFSFEEIRAGEWRKEQPGCCSTPEVSRKIKTNSAEPPAHILPESSSKFTHTTAVVNRAVPSHSNFMNTCRTPTSPEESGRVFPVPIPFDYQAIIEQLLAKLHDCIYKVVDLVSSAQICNPPGPVSVPETDNARNCDELQASSPVDDSVCMNDQKCEPPSPKEDVQKIPTPMSVLCNKDKELIDREMANFRLLIGMIEDSTDDIAELRESDEKGVCETIESLNEDEIVLRKKLSSLKVSEESLFKTADALKKLLRGPGARVFPKGLETMHLTSQNNLPPKHRKLIAMTPFMDDVG